MPLKYDQWFYKLYYVISVNQQGLFRTDSKFKEYIFRIIFQKEYIFRTIFQRAYVSRYVSNGNYTSWKSGVSDVSGSPQRRSVRNNILKNERYVFLYIYTNIESTV